MLRINSEPGFFTEIFTELKACGLAPVSSVSSHSLATANLLMNQMNNNNNHNNQQQQHHHSHHYLVQSPTGIQSPTGPLMSMSQSMSSTSSSHNMGSLIAAANKMNLNHILPHHQQISHNHHPSMITSTSSTSSGGSDSSSASSTSLHHHHASSHLQHLSLNGHGQNNNSNKVASGVVA